MNRHDLPVEFTRLVTPRAVRTYAEGLGWQRIEGVNGKIAVYRNPEDPLRQLIVPLDEQLDDYADRTAEAIHRLAEFERRPASEVLSHLLLPPADMLRFREVGPDAEAGFLSLDHAVRLIDGVRKVLLATAHSALVPQPYHPRMSRSEAQEFVSRCRLGHTERGSFGLVVACPLDLPVGLFGSQEPFARRVTSLLLQSLQNLSQVGDTVQIDELIDTQRHPGISANLCESLLLLRPSGDRAYLSISATWSRSHRLEVPEPRREIRVSQQLFEVAEALAPRLRSVPEPRIDRFFGLVDELRGQPTAQNPRPSGEVRFTLFDEEGEIRARANLSAEDYAIAGTAHLATDVVSFKGILNRLPRLNRIDQVSDFHCLQFDDGDAVEGS